MNSIQNFIIAGLKNCDHDKLIENLAKANLPIAVYSRLINGLPKLNEETIANYVSNYHNGRKIRNLKIEYKKNFLDEDILRCEYECQVEYYVTSDTEVPNNIVDLDEFREWCRKNNVTYKSCHYDEYPKAIKLWNKDYNYFVPENIAEL